MQREPLRLQHRRKRDLMHARLPRSFSKSTASRQIVAEEADAALVAAAKRGDNTAFEILVRRHQSRVLAIARRFTRTREDAEDILQQSFQKALFHLQQFEGNSSFSTWLTRITINESLMWLRKKRAVPEVPIEDASAPNDAALPFDFPDDGPSPEDSCLQHEREEILSRAMNSLPPGVRKAIELRELGELSTGETARSLGLSVGAVKSRLFHGRRKLLQRLRRHVGFAGGAAGRQVHEPSVA